MSTDLSGIGSDVRCRLLGRVIVAIVLVIRIRNLRFLPEVGGDGPQHSLELRPQSVNARPVLVERLDELLSLIVDQLVLADSHPRLQTFLKQCGYVLLVLAVFALGGLLLLLTIDRAG